LRKVSIVAASVAALFCFAAVALASTNQYGVTGSIASGGSKSKPKAVAVNFNYTIKTDDGNLSNPVQTYKIHFDGLNSSTKSVAGGKYCKASAITTAGNADACPAKTHVGSGEVDAFVGAAGQPIDPGATCNLALDIYVGGPTSLALFLHGDQSTTPRCIAPINQAIDAKLKNDSTGGSLTFTVPQGLLHPVTGLDSGITKVTSKIKKIGTGKKALFYSVGCKGTRKVGVTFTAEAGATETASATAGKC
jgi:hypothetical protein